MKNKIGKFFAVLLSAILLSATLASCGCRHEVLTWKIISEPTCTTEGKRQGPCVKCGEIVKESIPTDPEAHVYGDWEITKMPDYTSRGVGKAVKTCKENPAHTYEVTLPRLNAENNYQGYASAEITKPATVIAEGERTLVFEHELGNVQFVVPVEKRTFDPESETAVADAVLLGVSGHSQIRRGTGAVNEGMASGEEYEFRYTYGENYTYTYDEGMDRKQWTSLTDDGRIFGVYLERATFTTPRVYPAVREEDLQGFAYNIRRVNYSPFYGAEGLLNGVYEWGQSANNNRDYWESVQTREDGKTYFMFGFGYYSTGNKYFSMLTLEFTLNEELVMDYIRLDTDTYTNDNFDIIRSGEKNEIITCKLHSGAQPLYREYVYYNQITKTQEPNEPNHEYTEDNFKITNFDISYGGKKFTDNAEESPSISARGESTGTDSFSISNVQPTTASFTFDPLSVYRVMDNGRRILLDYAGTNGNIAARLTSNSSLAVKVKEAGTITLLFRTQSGYEKTIRFVSTPIAPTTLYPAVNEYFDTGYVWRTELDNRETAGGSAGSYFTIHETDVYVGQSLEFKAVVPVGEANYAGSDFSVRVITSNSADAVLTKEDGASTATFTGGKAGEYIIEMSSLLNRNVKARIRVNVSEPPARETILSGIYEGKIIRPAKNNVRLTFGEPDESGIIEVRYEVLGKEKNEAGELVETVERWETLYVHYDEMKEELVCDHIDGANTGIKFEINEAYRLVLVYPTGGFGGNTLKAILTHPEPEQSETPDESAGENENSGENA